MEFLVRMENLTEIDAEIAAVERAIKICEEKDIVPLTVNLKFLTYIRDIYRAKKLRLPKNLKGLGEAIKNEKP